jgi:hypothetical protein
VEVTPSSEQDSRPEFGGVATAVAVAPARTHVDCAEALRRIDNRAARRQTIYGFIATTVVMLMLLAGVMVLAAWLAP